MIVGENLMNDLNNSYTIDDEISEKNVLKFEVSFDLF